MNFRPHPYQGFALANLATGPVGTRINQKAINQNVPEHKIHLSVCHPERSEGPLLPAIPLE